ncbi:MAG TPA: hypothetical protein VKR80_05140 [Candidatus Limnocylindria bacterium]|nr:hypothetical protein [Candidatus Limnocylindria bacterium]
MRIDRILAAAFVVLVSTAIVGFSTGSSNASFTGTTTNPNQSWATSNVTAPASLTATSAIAGAVNLSWPATTTPANGHTVTYLVFRGGVQVGATSSLSYSDTPASDGTYTYNVQTKVAQGSGFFTSANSPSQSPLSDRTAPTMSATCNGGSCAGWFNGNVTVVVSGNDGAGVGMGTATTNVDGAGAITSAAPRTVTVSGESATHSVVYSGADALGNASGNTSQTVQIDLTAPTAATGLASSIGLSAGQINLTWTAGTDALSGVGGYTIHRTNVVTNCPAATTANYPNTLSVGAVTNTTVTGLASGSKYCFYLTTTDNAGNSSGASNVAGATKAK